MLKIGDYDYDKYWIMLVVTSIIGLIPLIMIPFIKKYLDAADNANNHTEGETYIIFI